MQTLHLWVEFKQQSKDVEELVVVLALLCWVWAIIRVFYTFHCFFHPSTPVYQLTKQIIVVFCFLEIRLSEASRKTRFWAYDTDSSTHSWCQQLISVPCTPVHVYMCSCTCNMQKSAIFEGFLQKSTKIACPKGHVILGQITPPLFF